MPLKKYQDEVGNIPNRIDLQSRESGQKTETDFKDITSEALDFSLYQSENEWEVSEVALAFGNATARNFTISKVSGANIVDGLNDRFWFFVEGVGTKRVDITPGFYSDSEFTAEIKARLEAVFVDISLTVTASYTAKKLTIVNSGSENMKFYFTNTRTGVRRNSTAAANMGFTADSAEGTTVTADSAIDIGVTYSLIAETSDTSLSYVVTDKFVMDSDSKLSVTTNTASTTVTLKVSYLIK